MNTALLNVKIDVQTKHDIKAFAAELGITSTAFVSMVLRQAVRERRVVLDVPLEPTPYLKNIMREAEADYAAGRNITTVKNKSELDDLFSKL